MSGILQLVNTFGPSGPFAVKNSLRLRSPASAYLSRTITLSATWTLSVWVKRGSLGVTSPIFGVSVLFNSNDTLTAGTLTTTAVYRDPSAWYHIVVSNSGCYVNGVSVGSTATGILVNPLIGSNAINYFDGYLAELNLVDGQVLTPSSFGAFDATSGVWQATKYSGTYGTNGFYLKFSDTTSTTTLCYDYSGNSNNWTPNNISLTAGSTYDSMLDSPTNYDNGGTGVGNYAVLNPLAPSYNGNPTFSNANLTIAPNVTNYQSAWSTLNVTSGKWYGEFLVTGAPNSANWIGISSLSEIAYTAVNSGGFVGVSSTGYAYYIANGNKYTNSTSTSYGSAIVSGDIVSIALDLDNGKIWFAKNGTWQASGDPVAGTNAAFTGIVGSNGFSFGATVYNGGVSSFSANFGQRPFAYTPPTGYKALNTQNLSAPSIVNGAAYMAATLYTGNGTSQSLTNTVNGTSFQPDLVWGKARNNAGNHMLADSVRGPTLRLISNLTNAEDSGSALTSFNSNGFSVNSASTINQSGDSLVAWQWKAGGTAVTNTAGSITSSVSANTTSGFAVVTYTGNGTASTQTIGHGLSSGLSMVIIKARVTGGNDNGWGVSHTSIAAPNYLYLNDTGPAQNSGPGQGQPYIGSGSTFNINVGTTGTNNFNFSGVNYVAYCFAAIAGYSAFGSYTGNGSADGPFVFTGMRPRWIMVKRTDSASAVGWFIWDTSRASSSGGNVTGYQLYPNSSTSESSQSSDLDILSNGFKLRGTYQDYNASGGTYIYAAFAESPFKYSLGR